MIDMGLGIEGMSLRVARRRMEGFNEMSELPVLSLPIGFRAP
jgi:hypothetical protein